MSPSPANEITRTLNDLAAGQTGARTRLIELIYDELRGMARRLMRGERVDHTLQASGLVHEAYMRLLGDRPRDWDNRAHFFGAAAEVMRRVLIDHARERRAAKRGGGQVKDPLDSRVAAKIQPPERLLEVDEALTKLEAIEPRQARVVKLRFFAGLTLDEIAAVLEVAPITVKRDWRYARAWLATRIDEKCLKDQ